MSFYTALTGLNGAQADISTTSNNIANVGTTGFKRTRAEFGDIFATSPLQSATSSIGSGAILKGVKQQFTQGNITASLNALDLAISGQGFFALKPSLDSSQNVYTRNGSLSVNEDRYIVDSAGQYLMVYPVNKDGSVTAKDLNSSEPIQLPVTSGDPKATSEVKLGVNLDTTSDVVTTRSGFESGYRFNPDDPNSFTNSTSFTIFDDFGNPTIATVYFIKTHSGDAEQPNSKYDTRLVIDDRVVQPDLVRSVDESGKQIYIDRFGRQTTEVPDDNFFIEGKGSPLYKLDDQSELVPSNPASVRGEQSIFDFGEEGDKIIEIVTDPLMFNVTHEAGQISNSSVFWGRNFLTLNVDNADEPVNVSISAGKYNATQLAAEVERAVNHAYGDERKIQIKPNEDDKLHFNFFKTASDGTTSSLSRPIEVDLLADSFVTRDVENISLSGISPDFTREQFLAHAQTRINAALNNYAVSATYDNAGNVTNEAIADAAQLGVNKKLFARARGEKIETILDQTEIITFNHHSATVDVPAAGDISQDEKYVLYSYYKNRPSLSVFDDRSAVMQDGNSTVNYNAADNTLSIRIQGTGGVEENETISLGGDFIASEESWGGFLNGQEFTVYNIETDANGNDTLYMNITGQSFPETDFSLTTGSANGSGQLYVLHDESSDVEAFFEGAPPVYEGSKENFSSSRIVLREMGNNGQHAYTNQNILDLNNEGIFEIETASFGGANSLAALGLDQINTRTQWVDEKDPPLTIHYDPVHQRFQFRVDRTVLGAGTESNFSEFVIYGNEDTEDTNNIGIPARDDAITSEIRGDEVLSTRSFIADGSEIRPTDKRYGIKVDFNNDSGTFTFRSGTTGERIEANEVLGVSERQKESNIEVGRYSLSTVDGSIIADDQYFSGDNDLLGVGSGKNDTLFTAGRGLAAQPGVAPGRTAQENLNDLFRINAATGENIFNVSINGISGVIEVPSGYYVGSTLAEELQARINQIVDPDTGAGINGVTVQYDVDKNNLIFTTGTTGDEATVKIRGSSRFGLDDIVLGVGTVPKINNLVQATDAEGIPLYVDAQGNLVNRPPENMVEGYYPLFLDEGELTFSKTGKLLTPRNKITYEAQGDETPLSIEVDFSRSTQLSQSFSVLELEQDGFPSGRLDGLEVDTFGTLRANYTNGQNNPLGRIVLVNFNNQNGLKQIGNAAYVETAVSGAAQVGEAGSEGFGTILSGSLERSNVDITEELVNLITAQRNFQASAKAIETTTSLTQTIINIRP